MEKQMDIEILYIENETLYEPMQAVIFEIISEQLAETER